MGKMVFAALGAALVLVVSFLLSLKAIDYFGLFSAKSGPTVSLAVDGKDSIAISAGTYSLSYGSSGAQSCEMLYRSDDGSSGRFPVPPNTGATNPSGLIGSYTLTCISSEGATTSKSVRITRAPK